MIKSATVLYYHYRFLIQRYEIGLQSNTSQVVEWNLSNCNFREAIIALAIGLLNGIRFSYITKRELLAAFRL